MTFQIQTCRPAGLFNSLKIKTMKYLKIIIAIIILWHVGIIKDAIFYIFPVWDHALDGITGENRLKYAASAVNRRI